MSNRRRIAEVLTEAYPVPEGLSAVIERAASDASFRARLLTDRSAALDAIALELSPRERAILDAISERQLDAMIARFVDMGIERRRFLEQTAVSAVTLLGGASLSAWQMGCEGTKKKKTPRVDSASLKEGGGHMARMDEDWRSGDPIKTRRAPKCPRQLVLGKFRTLSGPDRAPGEVDLEQMQHQLEMYCETLGIDEAGKVTFTFVVDETGAVEEVETLENTISVKDFEHLARSQLKRVVYFEAGEASKLWVEIELK